MYRLARVLMVLAVLFAACGSDAELPLAEPFTPGPDEVAIPFRFLGEDTLIGQPNTTRLITSEGALDQFLDSWEIDWESEVALVFTLGESGECSTPPLAGIAYDEGIRTVYPVVDPAGSPDDCPPASRPHSYVVAVVRDDLPRDGFSLWVAADESVDDNGVTQIVAGELTSVDPAGAPYPPLEPNGDLAVGESRIAYQVSTRCGLDRLYVTIAGTQWLLTEPHPSVLEFVPTAWKSFVRGEQIDLQVELAGESELLVSAFGSDRPLEYEPATDEVDCR